ncbi:MAG: hypothetical protein H6849_00415 [Alphaproteobacteria bacterium]|nr:MAG: hypothetical protein H6849_00415 [Alphaproteobacteria bacterium]
MYKYFLCFSLALGTVSAETGINHLTPHVRALLAESQEKLDALRRDIAAKQAEADSLERSIDSTQNALITAQEKQLAIHSTSTYKPTPFIPAPTVTSLGNDSKKREETETYARDLEPPVGVSERDFDDLFDLLENNAADDGLENNAFDNGTDDNGTDSETEDIDDESTEGMPDSLSANVLPSSDARRVVSPLFSYADAERMNITAVH